MICSHPLALRLEHAEAMTALAFNQAAMKMRAGEPPATAPAHLRIGGAVAVFDGPDSPLGAVKCLGMHRPVDATVLEEIEEFFFLRRARCVIDWCPLADRSMLETLGPRGYRIAEFETVTTRAVGDECLAPGKPGSFLIQEATAEEQDLWGRTLALGFSGGEEPSPLMIAIGRTMASVEGSTLLLARDANGDVAGGAALRVVQGVAFLSGSVTLPPYQRRGLQAALIHERLRLARRAGCDVAKLDTHPGTSSQRNAERAGFQVAYTRAQVVKEP